MATNRNPITGDKIITKPKSKSFDENFDNIFRKPKEEPIFVGNDDDLDEALRELESIIEARREKIK